MARQKKDNFPVKLRQKPTKKGFSLYLEHNANGKTVKRYLGLYLLNGTTAKIKAYNANVLEQAKAEQAKAIIDATNRTEQPIAKAKKMTFQELCTEYETELLRLGRSKSSIANLKCLANRINDYSNNKKVLLTSIDTAFCENFVIYLRTTKKAKTNGKYARTNDTKTLCASSISRIYGIFVTVLRFGMRKGYLQSAPTDKLAKDYKPQKAKSNRAFLELDELKRIESATCPNLEVKRAFLFACYCGLRYSDIKTLCTSDIVTVNGTPTIRKVMQKTGETAEIPLNTKALYYLGTADENGLYFSLPKSAYTNKVVHTLAKNANIDKDVCFHVSRHTFATTLLTLGGDIYTASKLLGHTNIATTQIYAEIVEQKKQNAMALFDTL